jgi:class 3 adenylate cyclase/tetratricopeptide (TPR) repeat protein
MVSCPYCGAAAVPNSRFCNQCGTPLLEAPSFAPRRSHPSVQQRVEIEKVLAARSTFEGERKKVSILFADATGSTSFVARLDPEDAELQLRSTTQVLIDAVHQYGGTICRIQGDGIMALFGAPFADEESAIRASYAALEMQRQSQSRSPLPIRVGLHSGEVFLRAVHNDLSIDYDAMGLPVHVAARMEQLARPGDICCTGAIEKLVRGFVETEALGLVDIKGLADPIEVFRIIRPTHARSRWDIASGRNLTPFFGRDEELRALDTALKNASAGTGALVAIVGDAGTGKSRLVYEFVKTLDASSCNVIKASASLQSTHTPYFLIGEVVRSWCGIGDDTTVEAVISQIAENFGRPGGAASQHTPVLEMLAGAATQPPDWSELDPSARRHVLNTAVLETFMAAAAEKPLVLWLEDLQWADSETLALLNMLPSQNNSSRLLAIVTHRPDRAFVTSPQMLLELAPLNSWASDMVLDELVGAHQSVAELRTLVRERAGGVPFFIEEIVLNLVESGRLRGETGKYELSRETTELTIPDSVQAVIAARIDRLAPDLKALLRAAAVLGTDFSFDRLRDLSFAAEGEIGTALRDLKAAHFILEVHGVTDARYNFVHALTHEVAYEGLPLRTRQQLHARAFETLRRIDTIPTSVEELAHHAERGALWQEAVMLLRKSGTRALGLSAYRNAHEFFERALQALTHIPDSSKKVELGIDIRLDLRTTSGATGEHERMRVYLNEAEVLGLSIDDRHRLGAVYVAQTLAFNLWGELGKSVEKGELAKQLARDTGDEKLGLMASLYLAQAYMWRGDFRSLLDILEPNTGWIAGPLRHERMITTSTSSVLWKGMIAASHAYLGNFESAIRAGEEACLIAREGQRPYDLALSSWYTGFVHSHRGDAHSALPLLKEAFGLCTSNRLQFLYPVVLTSLGYAFAQAGAFPDANDLLSKALAMAQGAKFHYAETWSSIYLGYAKMWAGNSDDALALSTKAMALARSCGYRAAEAVALRLEGEAGSSAGQTMTKCENAYNNSLAIASELGMRPDEVRAKLALSELYQNAGQLRSAKALQHAAVGMRTTIGLL